MGVLHSLAFPPAAPRFFAAAMLSCLCIGHLTPACMTLCPAQLLLLLTCMHTYGRPLGSAVPPTVTHPSPSPSPLSSPALPPPLLNRCNTAAHTQTQPHEQPPALMPV